MHGCSRRSTRAGRATPDYQSLFVEIDLSSAADAVHNGYFSIDKKKVGGKTVEMIKDTSGSTAADDDTY